MLLLRCVMLFAVCTSLLLGNGSADDLSDARATMMRYLEAQMRWQDNLARLVVEQRPEFAAIAAAQRDHQHALIALKRARFDYLVNNDPARLDTGELGRFSNFTWSGADTAAAKADPGYLALEERLKKARTANDMQPGWEAFRTYFRIELSGSREFKRELDAFLAELDAIEQDAGMK